MTVTRFDADHFGELFPAIQHSSWRWECQGHYAVDEAELQAWREGQVWRGSSADSQAWRSYIQGLAARGVPFERVRMLTDPLTEYLQWMLDTTDWNIESGEDIRWITQAEAGELDMPSYDFYLFDDNRVAIFRFTQDKVLLGADLDDDPAVVQHHRELRDRVWPHAIPHRQYRASHRSV